ncbi:MAG TPA: methyl-accepting chemotaxis protein, partial [Polyangiaceae bacterium]
MDKLSQRQLIGILIVVVAAAVAAAVGGFTPPQLGLLALVAVAAIFAITQSGGAGGVSRDTLERLRTAVRRIGEGRHPDAPPGVAEEVRRVYEALGELSETHATVLAAGARDRQVAEQAAVDLMGALKMLHDGVSIQANATEETSRYVRETAESLRAIGQNVEVLAASAEESGSSIMQMTASNETVAENIVELASSVRETVASIEEMAYSIKEVAKNVDALSLTAEETSSSMNEMDVSIDQVQSNANETARLSEEVAQDAERGAEAILKTIGEIYRIKESSQEAVSVISNLGSRIDAIGQILNVIDDVAEQTNLLALNAAIIAAQAGEHGKGFAVVADEIKDLAERAGGSTKEIAELIKTIQAESKNAIAAVERGAHNVDRGVEVSNEAERALKKILESSQKSTNMVRAIARAT